MPAAIAALEAAIAREEAEQKAAIDEAKAKGEVPPRFDARVAAPARRALHRHAAALQTAGKEIVWGV